MSIISNSIEKSEETILILSNLRDSLLACIKGGDNSLYPNYIEVCTDLLKITSDTEALKRVIA